MSQKTRSGMRFRMYMSMAEGDVRKMMSFTFFLLFLYRLHLDERNCETCNGNEFRMCKIHVRGYQRYMKEINVVFEHVSVGDLKNVELIKMGIKISNVK